MSTVAACQKQVRLDAVVGVDEEVVEADTTPHLPDTPRSARLGAGRADPNRQLYLGTRYPVGTAAGWAFAGGSGFFDLGVPNPLESVRRNPSARFPGRGAHLVAAVLWVDLELLSAPGGRWKVNQGGESRRAVPKMKDDSPVLMAKNRCAIRVLARTPPGT
jgi:hypothetical protein